MFVLVAHKRGVEPKLESGSVCGLRAVCTWVVPKLIISNHGGLDAELNGLPVWRLPAYLPR